MLGASSPSNSWTRSPARTPNCDDGRDRPGHAYQSSITRVAAAAIDPAGGSIQILYPRCAGLDVHKDTIVACVRCVSAPEHHEVRSFASTTSGLLALSD